MTMNYTEHSNKSRRFEADLEKRTFYQLYKKSAYADDDRRITLDYEYELWCMRGIIFD